MMVSFWLCVAVATTAAGPPRTLNLLGYANAAHAACGATVSFNATCDNKSYRITAAVQQLRRHFGSSLTDV